MFSKINGVVQKPLTIEIDAHVYILNGCVAAHGSSPSRQLSWFGILARQNDLHALSIGNGANIAASQWASKGAVNSSLNVGAIPTFQHNVLGTWPTVRFNGGSSPYLTAASVAGR